jgi:hypothetical protein
MSDPNTVSPLRQQMIEDMAARKLNPSGAQLPATSCLGAFWTPVS